MKLVNLKYAMAAMAAITCAAAPVAAQAQRGWRHQTVVVREWQPVSIRGIADRAERQSNSLRATFERNFDRYNYNRRFLGDQAKKRIQRMDENMEDFRRAVDDHRPWSGRDELNRAIRNARDVERLFDDNPRLRSDLRGKWMDLRDSLNELARIYRTPRV